MLFKACLAGNHIKNLMIIHKKSTRLYMYIICICILNNIINQPYKAPFMCKRNI